MNDFNKTILTRLIELARADGVFDPSERAMLRAVQKYLDVSDAELKKLISGLKKTDLSPTDENSLRQADEFTLVCCLYICFLLALSDGQLTKPEISLLENMAADLKLPAEQVSLLIDNCLAAGCDTARSLLDNFIDENFPGYAAEVKKNFAEISHKTSPDNSVHIIHNVLVMANADGKICPDEQKYLKILVKKLGVSQERFAEIFARAKRPGQKLELHGSGTAQIQSARILAEIALADGKLSSEELGLLRTLLESLGASQQELYQLTELMCDDPDRVAIDGWFDDLSVRQARRQGKFLSDEKIENVSESAGDKKSSWTLSLVGLGILATVAAIAVIMVSIFSQSGQLDVETFDKSNEISQQAHKSFERGQLYLARRQMSEALSMVEARSCEFQPWCDSIDSMRKFQSELESSWAELGYEEINSLYRQIVMADNHVGPKWIKAKHANLVAAIDAVQKTDTHIKDDYIREIAADAAHPQFLDRITDDLRNKLKAERADQLKPNKLLGTLFLMLSILGSLILIFVSIYQDRQVSLMVFGGVLLVVTVGGFLWWGWQRHAAGDEFFKIWVKSNIWTMVIMGWFVFRYFYALTTRCKCCGTFLIRKCLSKESYTDGGLFNSYTETTYHWICCRCDFEWTTSRRWYHRRRYGRYGRWGMVDAIFEILSR